MMATFGRATVSDTPRGVVVEWHYSSAVMSSWRAAVYLARHLDRALETHLVPLESGDLLCQRGNPERTRSHRARRGVRS